jgi:hypothetical protein
MKVPSHIAMLLLVGATVSCLAVAGCYSRADIRRLEQGVKYSEQRATEIEKAVRETDNALPRNETDGPVQDEPAAEFSPPEILRNMPVNSDSRCVGISLVAGALLEGEMVTDDTADDPAKLARQIYDAARKKNPVRYHPSVLLDDGPVSIQSHAALEKLSTMVADLYKQRHFELIDTEPGRQRLRAAMAQVVKSSDELDALLQADPDKIDTFFCVGMRRFPDGTFKDTNHAILIAKNASGEMVVYDSNDPGAAIPCKLHDTGDGVEVTWKCRYRDTGQVTTQRYQILPKDTFFRLALSKD